MRVILLGAPGAGKGTYTSRLKKIYKIPHISTGDLLREAIKERTETGLIAKEFMDSGKFVPDEIIINLLKERIAQEDAKNGIFLDGFPRTIQQAEMLDKLIGIDAVLNFEVKDETIFRRLSTRRLCKDCGEIFNLIGIPPKQEGICDKCDGELYQREDDKEEIVKSRLDTYREKTAPLVNFYEGRGILKIISCDFDLNNPNCTVLEECKKILDEILKSKIKKE